MMANSSTPEKVQDKEESHKPKNQGRKRRASSDLFHAASKKPFLLSTEKFCFNEPGITMTLGDGDTGQLGLGEDIMERKRPAIVPGIPKDVIQVAAGGMHTVCLTKGGEVWTFGCNDEKALGRDTSNDGDEMSPGRVNFPDDIGHVIMISAGDSHTAALDNNGKLFIWGTFRDSNGVLGLTTPGQISPTPVAVASKESIVKVVSGTDHIAFLTVSGNIYTFGCGEQGQLGRISLMSSSRGSRRGVESLLRPGLIRAPKKASFSNLWAGNYATVALCRATSTLYAWGLNNYCQLGFPDSENRFFPQHVNEFDVSKEWTSVALGQHHTIALNGCGETYAVGRGDYGRLGLGDDKHISTPTRIPSLNGGISVACGIACSFQVNKDGTGFSWGMGSNKQLSHGNEDDADTPQKMVGKNLENKNILMVAAGGQHTVVLIKADE